MAIPKANVGFHIGVACLGCGGQLELQENFFSLQCSFCGSALRVIRPDSPPVFLINARKSTREIRFQVDRYLKQHLLPLTRSDFTIRQIFYPYWKIDAISLRLKEQKTVRNSGTEYNYGETAFYGLSPAAAATASAGGDLSIQETRIKASLAPFAATRTAASYISGLPTSLGLRTEYIKAVPFSADMATADCEYFPVTSSWEQITANLIRSADHQARLDAGSGGMARHELFHVAGSIVYFPYFLAQSDTASDLDFFIVDGVSGRVVFAGPIPAVPLGENSSTESLLNFPRLKVDFHRCQNCGIDLPTDHSAIYICPNCHTVISLDNNQQLTGGVHLAEIEGRSSDRLFPFWSFEVSSDIVRRLLNPLTDRLVSNRLLVPGFRTSNFEAFYRLCRRITGSFSNLPLKSVDSYSERFLQVDYGLMEALAMGEMFLYREAVVKDPSIGAGRVRLNPSRVGLVYVPFQARNYFYVDLINGDITFEKSLPEDS